MNDEISAIRQYYNDCLKYLSISINNTNGKIIGKIDFSLRENNNYLVFLLKFNFFSYSIIDSSFQLPLKFSIPIIFIINEELTLEKISKEIMDDIEEYFHIELTGLIVGSKKNNSKRKLQSTNVLFDFISC